MSLNTMKKYMTNTLMEISEKNEGRFVRFEEKIKKKLLNNNFLSG